MSDFKKYVERRSRIPIQLLQRLAELASFSQTADLSFLAPAKGRVFKAAIDVASYASFMLLLWSGLEIWTQGSLSSFGLRGQLFVEAAFYVYGLCLGVGIFFWLTISDKNKVNISDSIISSIYSSMTWAWLAIFTPWIRLNIVLSPLNSLILQIMAYAGHIAALVGACWAIKRVYGASISLPGMLVVVLFQALCAVPLLIIAFAAIRLLLA